jgi:hypothetical protein
MRNYVLVLIAACTLIIPIHAGAPKDAPPTMMLAPGKLLVDEPLNKPLGKEWFAKPGKWEVVDGVLRGAERTEDMHGAVRRREVRFTSAVVQFQFKLDGATAISLSMNAEKGHVCRVRVLPSGFIVQRDKDKEKNDKPVVLDKRDVKISPKEWHSMIVEMNGKDFLARLDGKDVAFGSHDGLGVLKASVGFTVQGESASFKNLRVYEGTLLKSWEETKAKLAAERKKEA